MTKSRIHQAWVCALALLAGGCVVEERIAWSPNGDRAAVWGPAGLFLADPMGKLCGPLATSVTAAVWMPDGREMVVLREYPLGRWSDVAGLLSEPERRRIEALSPAVAEAIRGALEVATNGLAGVDEAFLKPLGLSLDPAAAAAALLCLRDTATDVWSNLIARLGPDDRSAGTEVRVMLYELSALALSSTGTVAAVRPLYRSLVPITALRASPLTRAVAFRVGRSIWAMPVDSPAAEPTRIAERVSGRFDWTPDAAALTYAVPLGGADENGLHLAHVQSTTLCREGDRLKAGATVPHVLAAFPYPPRLRYLGDGRLVFSAVAISLPRAATMSDSAERTALFLARWTANDPDRPRIERIRCEALPADLRDFEPSPDGRRIAIVESGSDIVAVLDVATAEMRIVQNASGAKTRALPGWRTPDELYFAAQPAPGQPAEWRCWTGAAIRVWSVGWPTGLVARLMEPPNR